MHNVKTDANYIYKVLPKLFSNSHIVLFRWEIVEGWRVRFISENCVDLLGYNADDFYKSPSLYKQLIHPDDIDRVINDILSCIEHKTEFYRHEPYRIITKHKQVRWIDDHTQIEYDENGNATYLNGFIIDITSKVNTNKRLEILTKGIENSPSIVVVTDINGKVTYVNQKFKEVTGYSFEEIKDKKLNFIQSGKHDKAFYQDLWNTILSGNTWKGEICNKKKNGDLFWEYVTINPIKNSRNEITHFLGLKEDITQRKLLEKKFKRFRISFFFNY